MKRTILIDYYNLDLFVTFDGGEPYSICTLRIGKGGKECFDDVEFLFTHGVINEIFEKAQELLREDNPAFERDLQEARYA